MESIANPHQEHNTAAMFTTCSNLKIMGWVISKKALKKSFLTILAANLNWVNVAVEPFCKHI